jgi:hypothetical protein
VIAGSNMVYSRIYQGPDAVRYGSISAATALKPDGLNDGHIEKLKKSGLCYGAENYRA